MPSDGTLKLQTNVPETVALQYSDGRPTQSQFGGDQVMFTLVDGRRMYLAPFVANRIREAGVTAGVPFSICKREVLHGNRRTIEYEVKNLDGRGAGASDQDAPAIAGNPASHQITQPFHGNGHANGSTNGNSAPVNGNGNGNAVSVSPAAAPAIEPAAISALRRTGLAAIDVVLEIEQHAQARGLQDFTFGADNIQKIWMSLFIDVRRNGGRS